MTEYSADDNGDLKIVKQKINEKSLPPNVDLLKLIYQKLVEEEKDYDSFSDDELEREKQRLLKELKEKESVGRKDKNKSQV